MKKTMGLWGVGLLTATMLLAASAKAPPENIKIDECMAKKTAVEFPHKAHFSVGECKTCHHTQADLKLGANVEVPKCSTCHLKPEKAETPSCTEMSMAKNPYHQVCLTCHKDTVKADATKKVPTKCEECHPKA
jgi:hypothetical protein